MQTSITFNTKEFKDLTAFLNKGVTEPAQKAVTRVVGYASNRMGLNARELVYSYKPKTNRYKRTGHLLGGRNDSTPAIDIINPLKTEITTDPRLKGAKINYAPIVNDGYSGLKKVKSFKRKTKSGKVSTVKAHNRNMNMPARPFFDRTIEDTEKEAPKLVQEVLDKFLANSIFK